MGPGPIGSILSQVGRGVMSLPEVQRQRRQEEEDRVFRQAQMEQMATSQALAEEQSQRQAEELTLQKDRQAFDIAYKTAEALPDFTPQEGPSEYGFPQHQINIPKQIAPIQNIGGTYQEDPTAQVSGETMPKFFSKPFETQRLMGQMYNTNARTQLGYDQLEVAKQRLQMDQRWHEVQAGLRARGLNIAQLNADRMATQVQFAIQNGSYDNLLNQWLAMAKDPRYSTAALMQMFGGQVDPNMPQLPPPPAPTPFTPPPQVGGAARPQSNDPLDRY